MEVAPTKHKVVTRKVKLGRPVETFALTQQRVREQIAGVAAKHSEEIAEALAESAKGIRMFGYEKDSGEVKTWERAPDVNAAKALWDYGGFKPTEKVEVKGTLGIVALVAQLENGDTPTEA